MIRNTIQYLMGLLFLAPLLAPVCLFGQQLYQLPADASSAWVSFENPGGTKGAGGKENKQAKGHSWDNIKAGEAKVIFEQSGAGIINRIWMTVSDRSSAMLRSLKLDIYWDGATKPAVSVPLGDFFGIALGRMVPFQNALFSSPEGRSFNAYIPMPYRTGAKIVITNESDHQQTLFYDVNFLKQKKLPDDALYFHAYWSRNNHTKLGQDFTILPKVKGKGRYMGANLGIITDSSYETTWWGEGEVKMYLDGDDKYPSLVGTGTEDYLGSAWSLGAFVNEYQGCPVADPEHRQWAFYRYHIPDPVYFRTDCKVIIQQMGGDNREVVRKIAKNGAKLIPVSVTAPDYSKEWNLLDMDKVPSLEDPDFPETWVNFYRLDNYSATAYFYLDKPVSNLPALAPLRERLEGIQEL